MDNLVTIINENLPYLLTGASTTVAISVVAIILGLFGAMVLNFAQLHRASLPSRIAKIYISIRSQEHTSELQSLMRISYAVFCLKKKTINILINTSPSSVQQT